MAATFPKNEHIRRKQDFQRVYQGGKKIISSSFILFYYPEPERRYRRLGITASRKVGNAVKRNRCKRLVREVFRQNKDLFPQDADIVIVVARTMTEKCYRDVLEEVCRVLQHS